MSQSQALNTSRPNFGRYKSLMVVVKSSTGALPIGPDEEHCEHGMRKNEGVDSRYGKGASSREGASSHMRSGISAIVLT